MIRQWIAGLVCAVMLAAMPGPAYGFHDVPEGYWAQEQIVSMAARELVSGYPDGTYRPDRVLTRAEAAVMLVNAVGLGQEVRDIQGSGSIFRDVTSGHWAAAYINVAWEQGFVGGYPDGTFRPGQQVNRVEMASMLVRALDLDVSARTVPLTYRDKETVPDWARTTVEAATVLGLVSGYPDGTFRPLQRVRRDEATSMLSGFAGLRGITWHFHGEILETQSGQVRMDVSGEDHLFPLSPAFLFSQDGRLMPVVPDPGSRVLVILDVDGQIIFMKMVTGDPLPGLIPEYSQSVQQKQPWVQQMVPVSQSERSTPATAAQAVASAGLLRQTMGLREEQRGTGEIIAIIDTGIDPRIDSLRRMPDGSEKLVDFLSLGEEGLVPMDGVISKTGLYADVGGRRYNLSGVQTQSGEIPYGWINEEDLGVDLNGNGTLGERLLVMLGDTETAGRYDRVYVDLRNNGRFTDFPAGKVFSESRETYQFPGAGRPINYVVTEIDPEGSLVRFGFDLNGHGTMMAAAAAGSGPQGGVAPGSQLLVIKAFNKNGEASWTDLEEAIRLAVAKGATVVNLSMGYQDRVTSGNNSLTYLAEIYSRRFGVVFVGAAGNFGPGTLSLGTPGNGKTVVTAGAYVPALYAKQVLGLPVTEDSLWAYSSSGPRPDGYLGVDVLAPGVAVLPTPEWDASSFRQLEGTSVASALLSGGVASVLSGVTANRRGLLEEMMPRALAETARPLAQKDAYQTGGGRVDLSALSGWTGRRAGFDLTTWHRTLSVGQGIFAREYLPGSLAVLLSSNSTEEKLVYWQSDVDWMRPQSNLMVVPAGSRRSLQLNFNVPQEPGLYTGTLRASVTPQMTEARSITVGVVVPEPWDGDRVLVQGILSAGKTQRHFINVPESCVTLEGTVQMLTGRLAYLLYGPQGELMMRSSDTGLSGWALEDPLPGTWELVLYSPLESALDSRQGTYRIAVDRLSAGVEQEKPGHRYLLGNVTRRLRPGRQWIGLSVRDRDHRPVDGVMLEIDGKLFMVRNGWINIRVDVVETDAGLQIRF